MNIHRMVMRLLIKFYFQVYSIHTPKLTGRHLYLPHINTADTHITSSLHTLQMLYDTIWSETHEVWHEFRSLFTMLTLYCMCAVLLRAYKYYFSLHKFLVSKLLVLHFYYFICEFFLVCSAFFSGFCNTRNNTSLTKL